MVDTARALEEAGADIVLLECVPTALADEITGMLRAPVIGIGAGSGCDGQILVVYDALGITPGRRPRFARDFLADAGTIRGAVDAYIQAVRSGTFPGPGHCFA